MKILVTGGSGFLGSHVADFLSHKGHKVFIFDKQRPKHLKKNQRYIKGNIVNYNLLKKIIKNSDIIYHFAGLSDLDEALNKPLETVTQNILGTVNILDLAKKYKIKRLVYASSVYATSIQGGFYSCSKKTAESYIEEYHKRYGLNFSILRYGSLYGLRSDERNGVYKILNDAIRKNKLQYIGNKLAVRKYIHVTDAAKASVAILSKKFKNKYVNIVGNKDYKITELFRIIAKLLEKKNQVIYKNKKHLGHFLKAPKLFKVDKGINFKLKKSTKLENGIRTLINEENFLKQNKKKSK